MTRSWIFKRLLLKKEALLKHKNPQMCINLVSIHGGLNSWDIDNVHMNINNDDILSQQIQHKFFEI